MNVLILGCGFTGERVARRFLARGAHVTVTARNPERLADLGAEAVRLEQLRVTPGALVLHSIPPDGSQGLIELLGDAPARVVYLSTTGVYGHQKFVNESTPAAPETESHRSRIAEERRVAAGPWSSLILRPAAIYGPGRGIHESIRKGACKLGGQLHQPDSRRRSGRARIEAGLLSGNHWRVPGSRRRSVHIDGDRRILRPPAECSAARRRRP